MKLPFLSLELKNWNPSTPDLSQEQKEKGWRQFQKKTTAGEIGFFDWPKNLPTSLLPELSTISESLRSRFDGAVVIGIGGSYLGAFAASVALTLEGQKKPFPLCWVSNTDGPSMKKAIAFTKQYRCCTIVISKSGNTTETLSAFYHLSPSLDPSGYLIVTDPQSGELRRLVEKEGWNSFPVPPPIGGRFSVLTAVGLLPLALEGIDITGMIHGAQEMRKALIAESASSAAMAFAERCFRFHGDTSKNLHFLMPYEARLRPLADWFVQLWAESLGKKHPSGNAVGFTPCGALGTSDQHSLLQLFKEGPRDKVIGFVETRPPVQGMKVNRPAFDSGPFSYLIGRSFEEINSLASQATEKSLNNSSVPTYRLALEDESPASLGAFFFFMETACALAGELFGVDAFNQPGVEEAKIILKEALGSP